MQVNGTVQLAATPFDVHGNSLGGRDIVWSSSDADVATVDINGLVSGVADGSATITATSEGKSASAEITVIHDISIEWDARPILGNTMYIDAGGHVVAREFFRWFNVIAGSGDVQLTATHRETGANISTSEPVQEGRRYRVKFKGGQLRHAQCVPERNLHRL